MPTVDDVMAKIAEKEEERAELLGKLSKSLLIQKLLPDAFAFGSCKIGGRATVHSPHKGTITFRRGDGSVVEKPAMEVPLALWPVQMRYDFEQLPRRDRLRIEREMT